MQITSIQITRRDNTGTKLKATVSIVLDDMVVIHDIKVLNNDGSVFLAMPSRSTKVGTFKDTVHPINQEVRTAFEQLIIGAYNKAVEQQYTKMEMKFSQSTDVSLLEQSCEMFEVTVTSAGPFQPSSPEKSSSPLPRNSKPNESQNDALLKWLES